MQQYPMVQKCVKHISQKVVFITTVIATAFPLANIQEAALLILCTSLTLCFISFLLEQKGKRYGHAQVNNITEVYI